MGTPPVSFLIAPSLNGFLTVQDLLRNNSGFGFKMPVRDYTSNNGVIFDIQGNGFQFSLYLMESELILRRNESVIIVKPNLSGGLDTCEIMLSWSSTSMTLGCGAPPNELNIQQQVTPLIIPSLELIRAAKSQNMLPKIAYPSEEHLRSVVYSALTDLEETLERIGTYNAFWDNSYSGARKEKPKPKRETDIHPTIHLLLEGWSVLNSIEIIPENKTGSGSLDFSFTGLIDGVGMTSVCAEVKHAHADDLLHGLRVQLPEYMRRKRAKYGAYIILWYKGVWFNEPTLIRLNNLATEVGHDFNRIDPGSRVDLQDIINCLVRSDKHTRQIRVFFLDVSKTTSASKA